MVALEDRRIAAVAKAYEVLIAAQAELNASVYTCMDPTHTPAFSRPLPVQVGLVTHYAPALEHIYIYAYTCTRTTMHL